MKSKKITKLMATVLMFGFFFSVSIFSAVFLTGCGGSSRRLSPDMLDGFRAVFPDDSAQMGIVRHNPALLTAFAADGTETLVYFADRANASNTMTQADIDANVANLYITDDFIYFMLATWDMNMDGMAYQFFSDEQGSVLSFLIDRVNNNVYSLDILPRIISVYRNTIMVNRADLPGGGTGRTVLMLSIEEDRVTYTDLVPNDAINALKTISDAAGNIFIYTDMTQSFANHPTMGNVFYIGVTQAFGNMFGFDENNNLYRVAVYTNTNQPHLVEVFRDREWRAPVIPTDGHIFLCFSRNIQQHNSGWVTLDYDQYMLLFDNWAVSTVRNALSVRPTQMTSDALTITSGLSDEGQPIENIWSIQIDGSQADRPVFLGESYQFLIRRTIQGQLFVTDLRTIGEWDWEQEHQHQGGPLLGTRFEMMEIANLEIRGNEIVATHNAPHGVVTYRIFINAQGNIAYERYVEQTLSPNIIVILPLF